MPELNFYDALKIFTEWLEDKIDELPQHVIKRLPENTLVTIFSKHPEFVKISNKFLNNTDIYQMLTKEELCLFIKDIYKKFNMNRSHIFPLFKQYQKNEFEGLRKPLFVKDYEMPIIKDLLIDEKQYSRAKKKKVSFRDLIQMIPQKQTREKCKQCGLYGCPQVLFDSNSRDSIGNVDVLFVAEAPGQTEVEKGIPLIGRSGQIVRKMISSYLPETKWFMTNVCLCRPDNNRTPTVDEIECCSELLDFVIQMVDPKIIVALGTTAMSRLGVNVKNGVLNKRKMLYTYLLNNKQYPVFCTVHPSYVLRNNDEEMYHDDFQVLINSINVKKRNRSQSSKYIRVINNVGYITKPDRDKGLVDIQIHDKNVWYIFKDKEGNRSYMKIPTSVGYYYYSQMPNDRHVLPANNVLFSLGKPFSSDNITIYESDVQLALRHSVDYYSQIEENNVDLDVMYVDIEVATENREFALQDGNAKYPVSIISFRTTSGIKKCLVNTDRAGPKEIRGYDIEYGDERYIIKRFMKYLRNVDLVTAWNIAFDLPYIILRCEKACKISFYNASPLKLRPYLDLERNIIKVPGIIVLDLLTSYRTLTYGERDFYSLGYIAKIELGEEKLEEGAQFGEIFKKDLTRAITYNIDDVEKIWKLDKKLGIIDYFNELRNVACVPWADVTITSKVVEGNILKYCKDAGLVLRNRYHSVKSNMPKFGGYVKTPERGVKNNIYVADFKSLYPSIIQTFNIGLDTLCAKFENYWYDFLDWITGTEKEYTLIIDPHLSPRKKVFKYEELKQYMEDKTVTPYGTIFYKHEVQESINNQILDKLLDARAYHKKKMKEAKSESEKQEHNNKQRAFKEVANSLYGYFGFEGSRFYNIDMVNTITITGQFINKLSAYTAYRIYKGEGVGNIIENMKKILTDWWIEDGTYDIKDIDLPNIQYADTDSIFFMFDEDMKPKELKEKGDEIFSVLNNDIYPNVLSKIFNYSKERCKFLLEYEYVCKGYWLGVKKRYVTRDLLTGKLTVKGLEINRSDYPALTKKKLKELVELILDEVEYEKIMDFVKKTEEEITDKIYNLDPNVLKAVSYGSNYKKVPSHVIAMMLWNILVNRIDFRVGNKGYLLPVIIDETMFPDDVIKKIQTLRNSTGFKGKFRYLAFPEETTVDEVHSVIGKYGGVIGGPIQIDIETILDFSWRQRYKILLEGILRSEKQVDQTNQFKIFDF